MIGRQRVVVLSRTGRAGLPEGVWKRLEQAADVSVVSREGAPSPAEAAGLLADADVLATTNRCLPVIDANLLDRVPALRHIVLYATGYDHLDLELLRRYDVALTTLPDYATVAVAEHGLAMLLALATRLHLANDRSRGTALPDVSLRGVKLAGRTVGVVGVGRIGSRLAGLCTGLGMEVLGCDLDPVACGRARNRGVEIVALGELLRRSDAVALCASHTRGAPPIVGAGELARFRPGALLVNAARAALVDTPAAVAAVRARHLRGYAVDDVVVDPAGHESDLLDEGRILQTGHSAWWRDEALVRGARLWGERILAAVDGEPGPDGDDASRIDGVPWADVVIDLGATGVLAPLVSDPR
jgi:phosphoglycerate dehydrogenase-like enzyme